MRGLRGSNLAAAILLALLAAAPLAAEVWGGTYLTSLLLRGIILAIAALSLDLLIGYGGMVSFGHAAFLGIGGYVTGIMLTDYTEDATAILGVTILVSAAFALVTGALSLRTSGVYFIMITLAFGQMLFFTLSSLARYGGDDGLTLWNRASLADTGLIASDGGLYYLSLALLCATLLLMRQLVGSRFGRVLRAAKENPQRVATLGFNVYAYRLTAYVIAGVIAGIAGFLLANQAEFVSPAMASWQRSGDLIIMVVLGGMGLRHGAFFGAFAVILLEEILSSITLDWRLIFGPLLVIFVLYARGGIARLLDRGEA